MSETLPEQLRIWAEDALDAQSFRVHEGEAFFTAVLRPRKPRQRQRGPETDMLFIIRRNRSRFDLTVVHPVGFPHRVEKSLSGEGLRQWLYYLGQTER